MRDRDSAPNSEDWLPHSEAQRRAGHDLWRSEVASRVQQHRARRRRRADLNTSLEFDFPADNPLAIAPGLTAEPPPLIESRENINSRGSTVSNIGFEIESAPPVSRKIIPFPSYTASQADTFVEDLETSTPLLDTPRIVYAAEPQQMELLPSFPDIRLDDGLENSSFPADLELPPQPASVALRIFSALVDSAMMLAAAGVFVAVFLKLTGGFQWSRPAQACAVGVLAGLWCMFQYLFLVYGNGTPGMRVAAVELCTFAGDPPTAAARRNRALAATLSAVSLGLGFLWMFVDEDTLGWHDRISETYLRPADRAIRPPDHRADWKSRS